MTALNHEQARSHLHIGRENLSRAEENALNGHLAECADCSAYAAEIAALRPALSRVMHAHWDGPMAKPSLEDRISARVQRGMTQRRIASWSNSLVSAAVVVGFMLLAAWIFQVAQSVQTAATPVPIPTRVNQTFGGVVTLLGYRLPKDHFAPGEEITGTLFWQAPTMPRNSYGVFSHVLSESGGVVSQSDALLVDGKQPAADWKTGQVIPDPRSLGRLPANVPPGPYQLRVGVYDQNTGARLKTGDGQDSVTLATILVELAGVPTAAPPAPPTSTRAPTPSRTPPAAATPDSLAYDADPNVLLVEVQNFGPLIPPPEQCYVLPDLRVWGDGRVVRVMVKDSKREVAAGRLSADRVRQLLLYLKQQGALSPWPPNSGAPNPSGARFVFKTQLKAGPVEQSTFPPPDFLPRLLAFFDGDVEPLVPQQAFLIATVGSGMADRARDWPARFNLSLAKAMDEGLWISGEAVNFVWEDTNDRSSQHTFRQDGKIYSVTLEIAGVGPQEPPGHCWSEWNKRLPQVKDLTLEQARQIPGFHLFEPAYLPPGFRLQRIQSSITFTTSTAPTNPGATPSASRSDDVGLQYTGPAGSQESVGIGQRVCVPGVLPPGMVIPATPDLHPETVPVHNTRATVNRYSSSPMGWVTPAPGVHEYIMLEWSENNYCFSIGGSLKLEELTRIANSLR